MTTSSPSGWTPSSATSRPRGAMLRPRVLTLPRPASASGGYEELSRVQLALNAHFRVLNALRETQLDHGRRLDSLERRFTGIEGRVAGIESEMRAGFSVLNVGMAQITAMLTTLIGNSGQNGPASSN
jgi:hypothetical protein